MDEKYLREALRLASRGRFRVAPNPRVGAVIVDAAGVVVGRGHHAELGGPHAEVVALQDAGARARDATLYLNLEPCCHHGRTPPCVDAVIGAGIRRVVVCHVDPNPLMAGKGLARLREAGVEVVAGGLAELAVRLNLAFIVPRLFERPAVTLKWAMSADGRIATATGESQWISSSQGRHWALELREEHDAILIGSGTLLSDNPSLDRRLGKAAGAILRVVIDRRLRFPSKARLTETTGPVLVYTECSDKRRVASVEKQGASVVIGKRWGPTAVLRDLRARGVDSLLVEGGGEMLAAFASESAFDRVEICCAPKLIGGRLAPGPLGGAGVSSLDDAVELEGIKTSRRGPDTILSGLRSGTGAEIVRRLEKLG